MAATKFTKHTLWYKVSPGWGVFGPYMQRQRGYRRIYVYATDISDAIHTFRQKQTVISEHKGIRPMLICSASAIDLSRKPMDSRALKVHLTGGRA